MVQTHRTFLGDAGVVHDVAIIGAGISGLAAAWQLQKSNVDFVVLEEQDYAGGRIKTVHHGEMYAESGAMVITSDEDDCLGLLGELGLTGQLMELGAHGLDVCMGRKIIRMSRLDGRVESWDDFCSLLRFMAARLSDKASTLPLPTPGLFRAYRKALAEIMRQRELIEIPYTPGQFPDWDRDSFAVFLDKYHPSLKEYLDLQLKVTAGGLAHEISKFWGIVTFQWNVVGQFYWMRGGTSLIPQAMMKQLSDRVIFNAKASKVKAGSPVEVQCLVAGYPKTVRARTVLFATPPSCVLAVFPGLGEAKRLALGKVPFGAYIVVLLACRQRFWERSIPSGYMNCSGTIFADLVDGSRGQFSEQGILSCFIAGPEATRLANSSEAEIFSRTMEDLGRMFPGCQQQVIEHSVHIWPQAIPYFNPGYGHILEDLRRPQGNAFFCGDYTQGAGLNDGVMSGKIASNQILEWLGAN